MDEILKIIEKARNLPTDHEPDVSDLWDILNTIEKIALENRRRQTWDVRKETDAHP